MAPANRIVEDVLASWTSQLSSSGPANWLGRKEGEGALDELLVELEDAAVAGVGVDHEVGVREPLRQIQRVAGGDHPVALAVGDQDRLVDHRQVGGRILTHRWMAFSWAP